MKNIHQRLWIYPPIFLACLGLLMVPAIAQRPLQPSAPVSSTEPSPSSTAPSSGDLEKSKAVNESSLDKFLLWISALLHGVELLSLVTFMVLLKDAHKTNRERDQKLSEKIAALEARLQEQKTDMHNLDSDLSTMRKSAARIQEIDQKLSAQQARSSLDPSSSAAGFPQPGLAQTTSVALSAYPFLDLYRQSPDAFKHQYSPNTVSEDSENIQKRWAGEQQEIILGEDRQGNYWLLQEGNTTYLIPSSKLKVNDMNMRTAGGLFECENYNPGYRTMSVKKPAIVSAQFVMGNQRWKLEQKGVLEFT
jgi:hypothetical protein